MKRAKKYSAAQAVDWCFIGRGELLHAFGAEANYLVARCGRGPAGIRAHVWVDAEPCKECLAMIRMMEREKGLK